MQSGDSFSGFEMYLNNKNKLLELFTTIMNVDSKNTLTLRCTLTLDQDPLKTHEKKWKNLKMDIYQTNMFI